jgi:hypothetical protein
MLPVRRGRLDEIAAAILATALADPVEDPDRFAAPEGHALRRPDPGQCRQEHRDPGNRGPAAEGGRNEGRHRIP